MFHSSKAESINHFILRFSLLDSEKPTFNKHLMHGRGKVTQGSPSLRDQLFNALVSQCPSQRSSLHLNKSHPQNWEPLGALRAAQPLPAPPLVSRPRRAASLHSSGVEIQTNTDKFVCGNTDKLKASIAVQFFGVFISDFFFLKSKPTSEGKKDKEISQLKNNNNKTKVYRIWVRSNFHYFCWITFKVLFWFQWRGFDLPRFVSGHIRNTKYANPPLDSRPQTECAETRLRWGADMGYGTTLSWAQIITRCFGGVFDRYQISCTKIIQGVYCFKHPSCYCACLGTGWNPRVKSHSLLQILKSQMQRLYEETQKIMPTSTHTVCHKTNPNS